MMYQSTEKGFTVIETLVALFIFVSSIVVLILISASGINNTNFAKNRLTANYLAQEGFELVRNLRDTTIRYASPDSTVNWSTFEAAVEECFIEDGCIIDQNLVITGCGPAPGNTGTGCPVLTKDQNGFFSYTGPEQTTFRRQVSISELQDNELEIIVEVFWQQGTNERSVSVAGYLYPWMASAVTS